MSHSHHISTANENLRAEPGERLARPFVRFAQLSCSGGLVLLAMTVLAMVWANSRYAPVYDEVFHTTYFEIIVEGDHTAHATDHAEASDDAHIRGSIASSVRVKWCGVPSAVTAMPRALAMRTSSTA